MRQHNSAVRGGKEAVFSRSGSEPSLCARSWHLQGQLPSDQGASQPSLILASLNSQIYRLVQTPSVWNHCQQTQLGTNPTQRKQPLTPHKMEEWINLGPAPSQNYSNHFHEWLEGQERISTANSTALARKGLETLSWLQVKRNYLKYINCNSLRANARSKCRGQGRGGSRNCCLWKLCPEDVEVVMDPEMSVNQQGSTTAGN